jgi:hypothetical protein
VLARRALAPRGAEELDPAGDEVGPFSETNTAGGRSWSRCSTEPNECDSAPDGHIHTTAAISSAGASFGSIHGCSPRRNTAARLSVQRPMCAQILRLSWIVIPSPA